MAYSVPIVIFGQNGANSHLHSVSMNRVVYGHRLMNSARKQNARSDWPLEKVLRAFDAARVRYLIIGGQAAIIYGASQITKDADFWVEPTRRNFAALEKALISLNARLRFLPPLDIKYLRKGHGIHFTIPEPEGDYYIDILGKPPRVSGFPAAYKSAQIVKWHGFVLRVLDIPRLVATKKTNREQDYASIQLLAEMVFNTVRNKPHLRKGVISWLLQESRTPEHLIEIVRKWKGGLKIAPTCRREAVTLAVSDAVPEQIQTAIDKEKLTYQRANIEYWKPFLRELRLLRRRTCNRPVNSKRRNSSARA